MAEEDRVRCAMSAAANRFAAKTRVACVDRAASNLRAERAILAARRAHGWHSLVFPCEIHKISGVFRKTFAVAESDVRGQIHLSLAVGLGAGMYQLRGLIRDFVHERLVIRRGAAPRAATEYRQQLVRLCVARGSRLLLERLCLASLPNGDWRKRGVLEVFVPERAVIDRRRVCDVVAQALQQCLAGAKLAKLATWPRHRWTGADKKPLIK